MQRHPQVWKGMCSSETSWKSQNLRRTQTAATVEGVTQTAKQDFKLYSQTIYPEKVSPNLEKMKQLWLELWCEVIAITVICTISYLDNVQHYCIVFYYTNPCFCPLSTHCNFFFLFFSNKIQVSLICSLIRRLSRYSQHADADGAPTYSLKRSINFKWLPYISLIALVSSHISIWGPAGALVRCTIIKVQSYIGVK